MRDNRPPYFPSKPLRVEFDEVKHLKKIFIVGLCAAFEKKDHQYEQSSFINESEENFIWRITEWQYLQLFKGVSHAGFIPEGIFSIYLNKNDLLKVNKLKEVQMKQVN